MPFVAVEFPDATPLMLHIHAARGVKLGTHGPILARQNRDKARAQAKELRPMVRTLRKAGKTTVREIMEELNRRGIQNASRWRLAPADGQRAVAPNRPDKAQGGAGDRNEFCIAD